jgi:hypothetical protein
MDRARLYVDCFRMRKGNAVICILGRHYAINVLLE